MVVAGTWHYSQSSYMDELKRNWILWRVRCVCKPNMGIIYNMNFYSFATSLFTTNNLVIQ